MTVNQSDLLGNDMGAVFSPCGKYRYRLWRRWDERLPMLAFLMLNPSVAGAVHNDQTVSRCIKRAQLGGFGAVEVVNLFALVSTDPLALYNPDVDPVGPENDAAIAQVARAAARLVCAWSNHGRHLSREEHVLSLLNRIGVTPHVLMLNKDGTPRHPLYVSYQVQPKVWRPASLLGLG
jgi:hypothetical protein